MNHWFLAARDVMWVFVAFGPVLLAAFAIGTWDEPYSEGWRELFLFGAFAFQALLLFCVYTGCIQ